MTGESGKRIERLEREVANLKKRVEAMDKALRLQSSVPRQEPEAVQDSWIMEPEGGFPRMPPTKPPVPPTAPGTSDAEPKGSAEFQFGSKGLLIAGGLLFVLGAVFLIQLAFSRGWIGPMARVILGCVVGTGIWAMGLWLDVGRNYRNYGQGLSAVGIVVLYFTLFASHSIPRYRALTGLEAIPTIMILGAVALLVLVHATWRQAPTLAGTAVFLVLMTTFVETPSGLLGIYYAVAMAVATFVAASLRDWPMAALGGVFVSVIALLRGQFMDVEPAHLLVASGIFYAITLVAAFTTSTRQDEMAWAPASMHAIAFLTTWFLFTNNLMKMDLLPEIGWAVLAGAAVSLTLGFIPLADKWTRMSWTGIGLCFLILWPVIHLDGIWVSLTWAMLAMVLGILSSFIRNPVTQILPPTLAVVLSIYVITIDASRFARNQYSLLESSSVFAVATIVLAFLWIMTHSRREQALTQHTHLAMAILPSLVYLGIYFDGPAITLAWAIEASLLVVAGLIARRTDVRIAGLAIFGFVLFRIFIFDLARVDAVWRVLSFLVVGTILLVLAFIYARAWKASRQDHALPPRQ